MHEDVSSSHMFGGERNVHSGLPMTSGGIAYQQGYTHDSLYMLPVGSEPGIGPAYRAAYPQVHKHGETVGVDRTQLAAPGMYNDLSLLGNPDLNHLTPRELIGGSAGSSFADREANLERLRSLRFKMQSV
jgi:hypothetical protein